MTFTPQIFRSAVRTTLEVEVKSDLSVIVRVPLSISDKEINRFIKQKEPWIEKSLKRIGSRQRPYFPNPKRQPKSFPKKQNIMPL